ncbi:hypothetical protein BDV32DRAFT_104654 [Aspergillus pseudonomiae]|uniref:Integral membrane protein n=2 Tax=Aspergillus subgen. Circumdati TaxID=2720871 RepID=A0A0L1J110_ASPN3|nr:uncharacterized protein ANOM_005975 [Aspergillus nomiae NRRL 13137]XP_031942481.1 uncharacterized protein BDV37DRAFT_282116 [Aspergillus pseudonomiae]KAB8263859.1 hypothetical protein BDV32DRAFT_104654 [Aspergillus pseudonomiae]KAE8405162.1 hypothetical protein BDV37DRAFT_282116 [Aspergillus pseudonomiae]KNG85360.1 hypothetical protein ANOM_005975 [Aspergillus nomiae NRRL 13137]
MSWETAYACIIIATLTAQSRAQGLITDVEGDGYGYEYGTKSTPKSMSAGMIVLCVIAGLVVLIGICTTTLFIIAKRRQWAMREVITRSARRATQAIKTPLSARFPRSQVPRGMGSENSTSRVEERSQKLKVNPRHNDIEKNSLITETERARKGGNGRTWGSLFSFRHP